MIAKYLAYRRTWGVKIEQIEVERETEKFVWIDGRRNAKKSEYENYFDSFDDAKKFLMDYADDRLRKARLVLQNEQGFKGNVKGLKAP